MADYTITISNTLNVFGPSPASQWGSMVWGDDYWGESKNLSTTLEKFLNESISLSDSVTAIVQWFRTLSNGISVMADSNLGQLQDGSGWDYDFPGGVTDPNDRYIPDYTEDSNAGTSYTEVGNPSTDWTDS